MSFENEARVGPIEMVTFQVISDKVNAIVPRDLSIRIGKISKIRNVSTHLASHLAK